MREALYKTYGAMKPVGTTCISNTFGLQVYEPNENDKYDCDYICSWHNGENEWGFHKHKVHYTTSGRTYLRKGSLRIYLDEIMKCN